MKSKIKKLIVIALATTMLLGSTITANASNSVYNLKNNIAVANASNHRSTNWYNPFTVNNGNEVYTHTYLIASGTRIRLDLTTSQLSLIEVGCINVDTKEKVGSSGKWNTNGGYWQYTIPYTGNYAFYFRNWSAGPVTFSNVSVTF